MLSEILVLPSPLSTAVNAVWCVFSSVTDLEVWERELKLMGCEHGLSLWCALQENLEAEFTSELRCLKEGWKFSCLLAIHKNAVCCSSALPSFWCFPLSAGSHSCPPGCLYISCHCSSRSSPTTASHLWSQVGLLEH